MKKKKERMKERNKDYSIYCIINMNFRLIKYNCKATIIHIFVVINFWKNYE